MPNKYTVYSSLTNKSSFKEDISKLKEILRKVDKILNDPLASELYNRITFNRFKYRDVSLLIDEMTPESYSVKTWEKLVTLSLEYIKNNPQLINYLRVNNRIKNKNIFFTRKDNVWVETKEIPEHLLNVAFSDKIQEFIGIAFMVDLDNMRKVFDEVNESVGIGYKKADEGIEL